MVFYFIFYSQIQYKMVFSICIPRAMYFVTEELIVQVFESIFGENLIKQVDMVLRQDNRTGEGFYLVFIHFNDSSNSDLTHFMKRIEDEQEVKVIYYQQWFWKCRKSTHSPKPARNGPRIMTVEDEREFKEFQKARLLSNNDNVETE